MNKIVRFALLAGLVAPAIPSATAQSTNVVQRANFALKGITQTSSGTRLVRVVNKDIIAALNATGEYQFGPKAALLFVSSDDQPPVLVVRDASAGTNTTTEVSDYFGVTRIGDEISLRKDGARLETWQFAFDNGNTNGETGFELWGSTTIHRGAIHTAGMTTLTGPQRIESKVRGVGRVQGAVTIFSGSISGAKATLEEEAEP